MYDKGEHRAAIHEVVVERKRQGKQHWELTIDVSDVFHDDVFLVARDGVVQKIRESGWLSWYEEYDELPQLVEELSETENGDEFDCVWDNIYDIADFDRVWIITR
jgi:hypothetical protein